MQLLPSAFRHARKRRCHDGRVERGFKLLERVCIVQQRDVAGAEVDHTAFGKCFRELKRRRIKAERAPACVAPPNSVRSAAIGRIHPSPLVELRKLLSPRDSSNSGVGRPTEAVCHSTAALNAYCELVGGCRRRRIKGNAL